jgi:hypothetical protein
VCNGCASVDFLAREGSVVRFLVRWLSFRPTDPRISRGRSLITVPSANSTWVLLLVMGNYFVRKKLKEGGCLRSFLLSRNDRAQSCDHDMMTGVGTCSGHQGLRDVARGALGGFFFFEREGERERQSRSTERAQAWQHGDRHPRSRRGVECMRLVGQVQCSAVQVLGAFSQSGCIHGL